MGEVCSSTSAPWVGLFTELGTGDFVVFLDVTPPYQDDYSSQLSCTKPKLFYHKEAFPGDRHIFYKQVSRSSPAAPHVLDHSRKNKHPWCWSAAFSLGTALVLTQDENAVKWICRYEVIWLSSEPSYSVREMSHCFCWKFSYNCAEEHINLSSPSCCALLLGQ